MTRREGLDDSREPILNPTEWPPLAYLDWADTCETLHLWCQVVGKVKLALSPFLNEWWNVAFTVDARGFTTGPIPWKGTIFDVQFDLLAQQLSIRHSTGDVRLMPLEPRSVADFFAEFTACLKSLSIEIDIATLPQEMPTSSTPFNLDTQKRAYEPAKVLSFFRALARIETVLERYRSPFVGKSSPVLFWWGSFDLSTSRFSGRPASKREWPKRWMALAGDQEQAAAGFWPGTAAFPEPAFFAYTSPEPPGMRDAGVEPSRLAKFDAELGEFVLRYADVRSEPDPAATILQFFDSAFEVGSRLAGWDVPRLIRAESRS